MRSEKKQPTIDYIYEKEKMLFEVRIIWKRIRKQASQKRVRVLRDRDIGKKIYII